MSAAFQVSLTFVPVKLSGMDPFDEVDHASLYLGCCSLLKGKFWGDHLMIADEVLKCAVNLDTLEKTPEDYVLVTYYNRHKAKGNSLLLERRLKHS